jgi:hypothetical protein
MCSSAWWPPATAANAFGSPWETAELLLGIVMLSPRSKAGHLDNLAVVPEARAQGFDQALEQLLLADTASSGAAMVSLTTCIPAFF